MKQAITVCAFIHKNGKLFAPRRSSAKKFLPNKFELPGGHIEYGEDLIGGLQREIREEFRVDIEVSDPFYAFTYLNDVRKTYSVEIIYFATLKNKDQKITLISEEHSEYKWVSKQEAEDLWSDNNAELQGVLRGFEILEKGEFNFG